MTKIKLVLAALVFAFVALAASGSDAWARRPCGDYFQNGRIVMGPDCDRRTGWQHGPHGRHWGPSRHTPTYYRSPPRMQSHQVVRQKVFVTRTTTVRHAAPMARNAPLSSTTSDGARVHGAGAAPSGAASCTKVIGGVSMTGKCW